MESRQRCRVCFDAGQFRLNDYEVNVQGNNISIGKMIHRFSEINIVDENVPETICESCTHDLVQSFLFTEKVREADSRILKLLSSSEKEPAINQEEVEQQAIEEEEEHIPEGGSQSIDDEYTEDRDEPLEDISESHIVEEVSLDGDCVDGTEDLISFNENTLLKRKYSTDDQFEITEPITAQQITYESDEKETEPKRRMYSKRRDKQNKEIYENGSFVITKFSSSAASKAPLDNNQSDDADEVSLSDVRIMNFEAVEIEAKDMNGYNDNRAELPIDDSRVYLCQYCPKAFSSSAFLVSHVRRSHGCKYCAQMFEKSNDLYQHIREKHSRFKCVVCEKEFVNNSNLRSHLKSIHKIKIPAHVALLSYKKEESMKKT